MISQFHSSQAVSNYIKSLGSLDNQLDHPLQTETKQDQIQSEFNFSDHGESKHQQQLSLKRLLISSFEMGFAFTLENSPNLIILIFITRYVLDLDEVAGFGLGVVYVNFFGLSLYFGLATGFEVIASHSYGAKKYEVVGLLLWKSFFIGFLMFIPIIFCIIYSKQILLLWNSNERMCEFSAQFCIAQIPSIIFNFIYYIFKSYLNSQNHYRYQLYISCLNFPFVFLYSYVFIGRLSLGIYGAAIVFNLNRLQNLIFFAFFLNRKPSLKKCFIKFTTLALKNNWDFLKVIIPVGAIVCADWIIYEIQSAIASNLEREQYAAHISLTNFSSILYYLALGYASACSTFVGNEMGNRNIKNAKKYGIYSLCCILVHLSVVWLILGFIRKYLAEALTNNPLVEEAFIGTFFIYLTQSSTDAILNITQGYLRAIGKEFMCSIIFLFTNGAFGLTMSYFLAYHYGFQLKGIWLGLISGILLNLSCQLIVLITTDMNKMVKQIHERIDNNDIDNNNEKVLSMTLV